MDIIKILPKGHPAYNYYCTPSCRYFIREMDNHKNVIQKTDTNIDYCVFSCYGKKISMSTWCLKQLLKVFFQSEEGSECYYQCYFNLADLFNLIKNKKTKGEYNLELSTSMLSDGFYYQDNYLVLEYEELVEFTGAIRRSLRSKENKFNSMEKSLILTAFSRISEGLPITDY